LIDVPNWHEVGPQDPPLNLNSTTKSVRKPTTANAGTIYGSMDSLFSSE
jgi:hypothetical protein